MTAQWFKLSPSYIKCSPLSQSWPNMFGSCIACKKFVVQTLMSSSELAIFKVSGARHHFSFKLEKKLKYIKKSIVLLELPEAAVHRCSSEKVLWKYAATLLKSRFGIFRTLFLRTAMDGCFWIADRKIKCSLHIYSIVLRFSLLFQLNSFFTSFGKLDFGLDFEEWIMSSLIVLTLSAP